MIPNRFSFQSELEHYVKTDLMLLQVNQVATWHGTKYSNTLIGYGTFTSGNVADWNLINGVPSGFIADICKESVVITRSKYIYLNQNNTTLGVKCFVNSLPKLSKLNK